MGKCLPKESIRKLCLLGNKRIIEECSKVYTNKKIKKGVAFPTSISCNYISGHFCPLEEDDRILENEDLIKIDLGVHIDGYPVVLAHSMIVGTTTDKIKLNTASAAFITI